MHNKECLCCKALNSRLLSVCCCLISASCYALGSLSSCWWLMLVWAIPLWWGAWHVDMTLASATTWYLIAGGGHLAGMLVGLYRLAAGPSCARLVVPLLVFMYYLIISLIWLMGTALMARPLRVARQLGPFVALWVLTTFAYLILVCDYSLIVCGAWEGYALFSPLIPLVEVPALLWPLLWVHERLFLLSILSMQAGAVIALMRHRGWYALGIVLIIWFAGAQGPWLCARDVQGYAYHVGVVTSQFFETDPSHAVRHIMNHVDSLLEQHPALNVIILPESSVYTEDVFSCVRQECVAKISSYPGTMVLGGFRRQGDRACNTAWLISGGRIIDYFDKQYLLPITEYIPWWGHYCGAKKHFFETMTEITVAPGVVVRPLWNLSATLRMVPYICSEFFLARRPRDDYGDVPMLVLCNNIWAPAITRWVMMRAAAFRAVAWQRTVIYVAHEHSSVMTTSGERYALVEESRPCGR